MFEFLVVVTSKYLVYVIQANEIVCLYGLFDSLDLLYKDHRSNNVKFRPDAPPGLVS